jgi:hypothetical protein
MFGKKRIHKNSSKKLKFLLIFAKIVLPLGYYYKYTTQGVLCILILHLLKLCKIKFEIAKPCFLKNVYSWLEMLKINHRYDIHQIQFDENIIHYSIYQIEIE